MPVVPLLAGAFALGVAVAAAVGGPWWFTALVAGALAAAAALRWPRSAVAVGVVGALVVTGHARFEAADNRPVPAFASVVGVHDVVGVAREDATVRGSLARVDIDVERLDSAPYEGGVRVTVPAPRAPLRAGDRIAFTGEIEPPPVIEEFDYASYLRARGIHAVAAYPDRFDVVGHEARSAPAEALARLRRWSVGNIERALPEPEASLAAGMLIGERRSMPAALTDDLRVTGTTHLVVVSGQNVALVIGVAVAMLTAFVSRRRAAVVALALLPAYVVFVGADPPVVRAAFMAVGIVLASALGRRTPAWVFLLYAVAVMLALDPLLARDVSFQLSASATAGVILVAPPLRDRALALLGGRAERWAWAVEGCAVATGAALAVLPVQAAVFERVSLVQVPANVVVAPLYEGTLLVAAAGALLGWLPPAADVLYHVGRLLPAAFVGLVAAISAVPHATAPIEAPLPFALVWYGALGGVVWLLARRPVAPGALALSPGRPRGVARTASLAAVAGGLWLAVLTPGEAQASVTVLDVGQGLAVLVEDGGAAVLIDAGPPDGAVASALPRAYRGRSLDAVILTHDDADHAGGLPAVERRVEVERVFLNPAAHLPGAPGDHIAIGDRVRVSDRTTIEVLSPPLGTPRDARNDNDASLVLLVTIGDRRVLLPADIAAPAERRLTSRAVDLRADALVVPHHGSNSSSTPEFIAAVRPQVAVISVGARNPYGHPNAEALARYEGVRVYRTDQHGNVALRSDGRQLWVQPSR